MDVRVPLKIPLGDIGQDRGHIRLYWSMDMGCIMLVFRLSLAEGVRTVRFHVPKYMGPENHDIVAA